MIDTRLPLMVIDSLVSIARTIDSALETTSIQNARNALVEGRRGRVLRMLLEDLEAERQAAESEISAASGS